MSPGWLVNFALAEMHAFDERNGPALIACFLAIGVFRAVAPRALPSPFADERRVALKLLSKTQRRRTTINSSPGLREELIRSICHRLSSRRKVFVLFSPQTNAEMRVQHNGEAQEFGRQGRSAELRMGAQEVKERRNHRNRFGLGGGGTVKKSSGVKTGSELVSCPSVPSIQFPHAVTSTRADSIPVPFALHRSCPLGNKGQLFYTPVVDVDCLVDAFNLPQPNR